MSAQQILHRATGLTVPKTTAERAVKLRMERTGARDADQYLDGLTADELTALIELVVVPESWLFRDAQAFVAAIDFVQGRLARSGADKGRPVRILSIPCAGGEEPYSIAMALRDANVPKEGFTIDAYDLSPGCVARAQAGVYGRNAFRAQDLSFRDRYFTHLGDDDYRIIDSIREQITFRQGNLVQFDVRSRARHYDIIFCRNLLIYFDKPTTKAAIANLAALLADDGMLFAGYAEVPSFIQNGFCSLPLRQAFALKKDAAEPKAAPLVAARPRAAPAPKRPAPAALPLFAPVALAPALAPARLVSSGAPVQLPKASPAQQKDMLEQARALADRGQFKDAAALCQAHLAAMPESAEAYFILGILSEHGQQMTAAEDHWRRCIYLQPDHYDALCHLALLAEANGNQAGAAALKARAARIYQRQRAS